MHFYTNTQGSPTFNESWTFGSPQFYDQSPSAVHLYVEVGTRYVVVLDICLQLNRELSWGLTYFRIVVNLLLSEGGLVT